MNSDAIFTKCLTAESAERAETILIFFSAFSASSAVNDYFSFSIRSVAFQTGGCADT